MKNNQTISPNRLSKETDDYFETFRSLLPEIEEGKLRALWYKSQTFRGHWEAPDNTILKGQTATRSEASILFSCFAHFGFSRDEAAEMMRAWMSVHPELACREVLLEEKILDAKWKEAMKWKEQQVGSGTSSAATAQAAVMGRLVELMVIEQFSYDPMTKKCSVVGLMK